MSKPNNEIIVKNTKTHQQNLENPIEHLVESSLSFFTSRATIKTIESLVLTEPRYMEKSFGVQKKGEDVKKDTEKIISTLNDKLAKEWSDKQVTYKFEGYVQEKSETFTVRLTASLT